MSISRRDAMLGAGAAAVAVAGVPGAVQAVEPLLAMEREWLAQLDYIHNYPDDSDAALNPLYDRKDAMEEKILYTPAHSFAGIAVKLRLALHYADPGPLDPEGFNWDVRITLHALSDAERLAGESRS